MSRFFQNGIRWDEELVGMLQYVFITQRKHDIAQTAKKLGMGYNDLYAFVSGRRTMPPQLLVRLTEVTNDMIFLDTVFKGSNISCDWVNVPRNHSGDIVRETLEAGEAIGALQGTLHKALADSNISDAERRDLLNRTRKAIDELNDVQQVLTKEVTHATRNTSR